MNAPIPHVPTPQQDFDIGALYQGSYLKADDLQGRTYQATIGGVERVEIAEKDGSVRPKAALVLQGWPLRLLLNKVNFETLAAAYGRQSAGWRGRPLEIFPATASFGGRTVPAIRVRVPAPAAAPTAIPGAAAPAASAEPAAPAAAPVQQTTLLPPLLTADELRDDDIPY